ncbi:unnamed protein product [Peniophora sp. CBMAI 1063]|nr:unnamed protein product [Peniophora sp. CBMAI 1063]
MGSHISSIKPSRNYERIAPSSEATSSPISRLPDDVLYMVFEFAAKTELIYDVHGHTLARHNHIYPSYNACLGWTRLSAVCRQWRAVLLTVATAWGDIAFFLPPDIGALALTRSGTASVYVVLPMCKDTSSPLLRKIARRKRWGLSHTHRERLVGWAAVHALRINGIIARDLSGAEYKSIFQAGVFNTLGSLVLDDDYHGTDRVAPTAEDLGNLHVTAPHVRHARLSPTLPIACGNGPGLRLSLPGLQSLCITIPYERMKDVTTVMHATQIQWVAPLIRGAQNLRYLKMEIYNDTAAVDWFSIFGPDPLCLGKLDYLKLGGGSFARMDGFLDMMSNEVPPKISCFQVLVPALSDDDIQPYLHNYIDAVQRSMCKHSLDCIYVTPTTFWRNPCYSMKARMTIVEIIVFSGTVLTEPGRSSEDVLDKIYTAECRVELKIKILSMPSLDGAEDPRITLNRALSLFNPILASGGIRTLVVDQSPNKRWTKCVRRFIQTSLSSVSTLYCLDAASPQIPKSFICTKALRLSYKESRRVRVPAAIMPNLTTIYVSMNVSQVKTNMDVLLGARDVRTWWKEILRALTSRHEAGMRPRKLQIIGGWASEKLRNRTAKMDAKMLVQVAALVEEVHDQRAVYSAD